MNERFIMPVAFFQRIFKTAKLVEPKHYLQALFAFYAESMEFGQEVAKAVTEDASATPEEKALAQALQFIAEGLEPVFDAMFKLSSGPEGWNRTDAAKGGMQREQQLAEWVKTLKRLTASEFGALAIAMNAWQTADAWRGIERKQAFPIEHHDAMKEAMQTLMMLSAAVFGLNEDDAVEAEILGSAVLLGWAEEHK